MKGTAQTPAILRVLRSLKVVVIHPQDQDGEELLAQLQRIGCDVAVFWPKLDCLPFGTGLVLMAMRPASPAADCRTLVEHWGRLHAVRTALGVVAMLAFLWAAHPG